jgi:hypothetical protein
MGFELLVGDDLFRHGEGLWREGGKERDTRNDGGVQTRTANHGASNISLRDCQTILFAHSEKYVYVTFNKHRELSECGIIILQRSVSVDCLSDLRLYIQRPLKH